MQEQAPRRRGPPRGSLPAGVWALGVVSLFMDTSSEAIQSLLPVFLVSVLGASTVSVGLIEGVAEATALITRTFSGALSDWLGRRKALALAGYGLATLSKPLFAVAASVEAVFVARFIDRIGKGIRGAPRDALVADLAPAPLRGSAFGLRQSLDTVGAVLGPGLAMLLMTLSSDDFRLVFWLAVIPAAAAVAVLATAVHEPARSRERTARLPLRRRELARLPSAYWLVVTVAGVFTLARFSEAFMLLKAESIGLREALVPMMLAVMSVVYSATAYPVGRLSDRIGRSGLLASGLLALIAADLVLAAAGSVWSVALGSALWGLHMGLTQGLLVTLVADTAGARLRGTAYGMFSLVSGLAMLVASVLAGGLWQAFGPAATFLTGAGITALALAGFAWLGRRGLIGGHPG
ncbi:MAG TPA: MFS transporter [Gammaproteobacteria bacterium]|nr:MFS transporter [Gammaproteobacteria bacterium]